MKIVVIRFSSLGDVVLLTPLFQKIKDLYPSAHLSFLTDGRYFKLLKGDPNLDEIIPYDVSNETPIYLLKFLRRIRKRSYDVVIDCHIIPRSLIFLFFGGGTRRLKVDKFSRQRRRMIKSHIRKKTTHVVDRYLAVINEDNGKNYRPRIYLKQDEIEKGKAILERVAGKRKVVGFVPAASKSTKMWELDKLRDLARRLTKDLGMFVVFFGDRTEISLVRRIRNGLANSYLDLSGKTDIRELAVFMKGCDIVFTTDSGPMHIAVAVDTPVVSIFGPTVEEFGFSPYDNKSVIVSKPLRCRPCSLHGSETCPLEHHNCMKLIEVSDVSGEIERLLQKTV